MHIVHYKSIYTSLADALSVTNDDREAVAVMAVFFKVYSSTKAKDKNKCPMSPFRSQI